MGLSPAAVAVNLAFFERHGGYCGCEVWMNVERSVTRRDPGDGAEEEPGRSPAADEPIWSHEP